MQKSAIISVLVGLVLLSALIPQADAIKCYVCASSTTSGCADTFSATSSTTDCGSSYTYCQKYSYTVAGASVVARTCSNTCSAGSVSLLGVTYTTACCTTDNCNSSTNIVSNKMIIGLSTLIAIALAIFKFN